MAILLFLVTGCPEAPKKFELRITEGQLVLSQENQPTQSMPLTDANIIQLAKGSDGNLLLQEVSLNGQSPIGWVKEQDRQEFQRTYSEFLIRGEKRTDNSYVASPSAQGPLRPMFEDRCSDYYVYSSHGQAQTVIPIRPLTISLDGENVKFDGSNSYTSPVRDERGIAPIFLVNCPDLISEGSSNIMVGGGLGVTILVDNIIDPDAQATGTLQDLDFLRNLSFDIMQMQLRARANCIRYDHPNWAKAPFAVVDFAQPGNSIVLHCNRYLQITTPSGNYCIDITTCPASLTPVEDSMQMEVRTRCDQTPPSTCP